MRKPGQASAIIGVLLAALWQCTPASAQQAGEEGAYIDEVVNVIREALKEAQTNNIGGFPPLQDATISLQALTTVGAGGVINFWILTIGTKYERETASTVKLVMTSPPTMAGLLPADKLKLALARAINLAKAGILSANKQEPRLRMSNVEIEIKFAVKVEGSGGIKIAHVLPIGIEGTGKLNRNQIHTITLRFKEPEPKPKPKPDAR